MCLIAVPRLLEECVGGIQLTSGALCHVESLWIRFPIPSCIGSCGDVPGTALPTAEMKVTDKEPCPETVHGWRAGTGNLECRCG